MNNSRSIKAILSKNDSKSWARRIWAFLKHRPYVITIAFVVMSFALIWVTNRERPYLLSDLPRDVLTKATENFCVNEAKFKVLKTTFKHEYVLNDVPVTVTVERVEENVGKGVALRREKWFHENSTWPVYESRQYISGAVLSLKFDDRQPSAWLGSLMKEDGWMRSRTVELKVNKRNGVLGEGGSTCEYEKRATAELNDYTGLRESILQQTRCATVLRLNASAIHPKLAGDAYQVNCESERVIDTSGGIPSKDKKETTKRISVYYFVPAWSWMVNGRRSESGDLPDSENFKGQMALIDFSFE